MITKIKEYRVKLDKYAKVMSVMPKSREISVAITRADDSKMWLGQTLKRLEQDNPYPDSKNAANTKIAPTADVWDGNPIDFLRGVDHIQNVKRLRSEFSNIADEIENMEHLNPFDKTFDSVTSHSVIKAWDYMTESNMWLGMELGRIFREKTVKN